ncbi:MAG: hypothetical protein A2W19_06320 [Spirochaetes bacterium RBG_16_49_21]|nr:MAG: hypothetical protein A2W19_06320 [Spirochaetes bacterium RBG_16_49_21]
MKTAVSIFVILLISGCSFQKRLVGGAEVVQAAGEAQPDWFGADIKLLPISNNTDAMAEIAAALSVRSAPLGQKVYAMRLALYANSLDKKNKHAAIVLARAAFLLADSTEDEEAMKKIAEIGVTAARTAGVNENNPEACYYFALNQGLLVRSKGLFALNKLPDILNALKISQKKDTIDHAGPLRVLGILYLKAPAWPSGIGDLDKALELLEEAVKKEPAYPQNFMFYAEALIEDDSREKALQNLEIAYQLAVPEIWGVYYSKKWRDEIEALRQKINKS